MAEELSEFSAGEFQTVSELLASDGSLQALMVGLVLGLGLLASIYRWLGIWMRGRTFSYTRPHVARFTRSAMLAFFAIGLVTSINLYTQWVDITDSVNPTSDEALETFAKILNTIKILVIGYTVSQLIPIALNMAEKSKLEDEDFENWKGLKGFKDDDGDLFHKLFKWIPPKTIPEDLTKEEFEKNLQTKEGLDFLENYRTGKGVSIGSYETLMKDPGKEWKKAEREKYEKYLNDCLSGNNQTGRKLVLGSKPQEIYPIDLWREEKRQRGYEPIIPASKPAGHRKNVFRSQLSKFFPLEFLSPLLLAWLDGGVLIFLSWLRLLVAWHWVLD